MVQAIAQTSDGFIWIGTQEGLARFDGEQFEFVPGPGGQNSQELRVSALEAADGGLWVATGRGLFRFKAGAWIPQPLPARMVQEPLLALASCNGEIWAGTRAGLLRQQNGNFVLVGDVNSQSVPRRNSATQAIRSIRLNAQGDVWIAAGNHLVELHDGVPMRNEDLLRFQPYFIRTVCCTRDGSVWAGTHAGLIRLKDGEYTQFTKSQGLPDDVITAVHEDRRGNLWVGTFNGLCRFVNGRFVIETKSEGEPYDQIFCFFEDRENNLWIGAKDGLYQFNAQAFTTYSAYHGLGHKNVMSVYQDKDGAIWAGTWGGGLHCVEESRMTVYSKTNQLGGGNDLILAIQGARDGSLWFSEDYGGGLYRIKNGNIQQFGNSEGVPAGAIRAVMEDHSGRIWIGHASGGLGYFEKQRLKFYNRNQGMPTNNVRCILESKNGKFWIGTEGGLVLRSNATFTAFTTANGLSDNVVLALYEDKVGNLWIGTEKGLCRLSATAAQTNSAGMRFQAYGTSEGLIDHAVIEILEDDFDNLWLASRRGIFRVARKEFDELNSGKIAKVSCAAFGKEDGMKSQICVGVAKPSAIKAQDGRLWFATTKGLAVTDPKLQIAKNETPPPVLIRKMLADKKGFVSGNEWRNGANRIASAENILIPPGRGELEFHYTALSFTVPEKNRFKYRLENFDPDWVEAGTRHVAYYNNIPPGDYRFHVIACNNDGVWNSVGTMLDFTLQPHFWQSWWFRISCGVAGLTCVMGTTRYVTKRRMQRKIRRLEEQHAIERERARIAKDIHDDLGASLTRIAFLGELAETDRAKPEAVSAYVQRIVAAARDTVRGLDEIVWAVNPRNDTLDSLMEYIAQFVYEFFQNTPVRCRLDLPDDIPAIPLSSEMRHNVFLVVKEALNNSLKHANATSITARASLSIQHFEIEIGDDGRGFDPSNVPGTLSNGLENMRRRIEDLGGKFELKSSPGKGTQLKLSVPLSRNSQSLTLSSSHLDANRETSLNP